MNRLAITDSSPERSKAVVRRIHDSALNIDTEPFIGHNFPTSHQKGMLHVNVSLDYDIDVAATSTASLTTELENLLKRYWVLGHVSRRLWAPERASQMPGVTSIDANTLQRFVCVGRYWSLEEWQDTPGGLSQSPNLPYLSVQEGREPLYLPAHLPVVTLAERLIASIDKLTTLAPGWDGYKGVPVFPKVAEHARKFLTAVEEHTQIAPDVVPLSDGGMQLEWFVGAYEIEVMISSDCATQVFVECERDGIAEEFLLSAALDLEKVAPFFRELRR